MKATIMHSPALSTDNEQSADFVLDYFDQFARVREYDHLADEIGANAEAMLAPLGFDMASQPDTALPGFIPAADLALYPDELSRLCVVVRDIHHYANVASSTVALVTLADDELAVTTSATGPAAETVHGLLWRRLTGQTWRERKIPATDNQPRPGPSGALPVIDPSVWQGQVVPRREWFVDGLIPTRTVTLLSGDGGVGKSLLALQIGAASALGCASIGLVPAPGRVLYLGAEDEADEFQRRFSDIVRHHGRQFSDLSDFRLVPLADRDALLSVPNRAGVMEATALWEQFVSLAKEFQPGLVVLDTSADLYGGDEIKRAQVRGFVAMLRKLALEIDCAVLLLSHPSVAGMEKGTGLSGSTAWNNSVRSRLYLTSATGEEADPDGRVLTTMKNNYGKTGEQVAMRWNDGLFVPSEGQGDNPAAGLMAGHADKLFLALLSKLCRLGQACSPNRSSTYAPTVMSRHPDGKPTGKAKLEAAMHRLLDDGSIKVVNEGPPSKPRARLVVTTECFSA